MRDIVLSGTWEDDKPKPLRPCDWCHKYLLDATFDFGDKRICHECFALHMANQRPIEQPPR